VTFTYPEVGATRGDLPAGYHHLYAATVLGEGRALFERAGDAVLRWQVQRGAGLDVRAEAERAAPGVRLVTLLRLGPVSVPAPCEVVYVVDEPYRRGYAYGTLPGHPEVGEESFVVSIDRDDVVTFEVVAFSRAGTWWARLGGPVSRWVQRRVTARYLTALPGG
jgi:uncharacterized protein (UPF0548 family)